MSGVLGVRQMQDEIRRMNRELEQAEDPAAMAAGVPIAELWRSLVPVEDNYYRDSITVAWLKGKGKAAVGTAWVASLPRNQQPFVYSTVHEYGDSDTAAQPSARPALKGAKQDAIDAAAVPLKAVVKRRKRKKVATV